MSITADVPRTGHRFIASRGLLQLGQRQGALIALLLLFGVGALRYGSAFATGSNLTNFLADDVKYGLLALGMTFVILGAGIDLSVGSVMLLGGVVAGQLSTSGAIPGFGAALVVGMAIGAFNGVLIAYARLEPFIVTLATLLAVRGAALLLSDRRSVVASAEGNFQAVGRAGMLGLPVMVWLLFFAFVLGALVLHFTDFGRAVLAFGGNEQAARLMGVRVDLAKCCTYIISGGCAGLAGAVLISQNGSIAPGAGVGWELSAIAAVMVGGTLLSGGVGSVMGSLVGVILLQLIFNMIVFENSRGGIQISPYWESVIRGGFLLFVVLLQVRLTNNGKGSS